MCRKDGQAGLPEMTCHEAGRTGGSGALTWRAAWKDAAAQFSACRIPEPETDAKVLLKYAGDLSDTDYLLRAGEPMPEQALRRFREAVEKRKQRIPVQHITGRAWFMGFEFRVNADVLVPRQDTEILVELASGFLKERQGCTERTNRTGRDGCMDRTNRTGGDGCSDRESRRDGENCLDRERNLRALDLCTGSGCIAVSLSRFFPELEVDAGDISPKALAVARENGLRNNARVRWYEGDLFDGSAGLYDLIVSNPPYIAKEEIGKLDEEVRLHDPVLALDGGADGLLFYRRIAAEAGKHLVKGGGLFLEIGCGQAGQVEELLRAHGFGQIRTNRDLAGLDRVVSGILSE